MQKKKDSDGMERTIPCPHKVHTGGGGWCLWQHTITNYYDCRVATKCFVTMLPCVNIFIPMGLVSMYVQNVVKHLSRVRN